MKNIFLLFWIVILLCINLKAYKDLKNTNAVVKRYSLISIILSIVFIIMFVLSNYL